MCFDKVKENLTSHGYTVSVFENSKEANEYLCTQIVGKKVGIGGSMTVKEMGLYELLKEKNDVSWHLYPDDGYTAVETIGRANAAEIYISSANALSEDGEIINIDGTCNRISSTLYGPKKVYLVIGKNKLANDYDSALYRARNVAAPMNARRLNKKTPCAINADKCYNCKSPERICRALTVFWTCPRGAEYEIVLINENLGY